MQHCSFKGNYFVHIAAIIILFHDVIIARNGIQSDQVSTMESEHNQNIVAGK